MRAPFLSLAIVLGLMGIGAIVVNRIDTPYASHRPGPTIDVQGAVEPAPVVRHGALYLTTVMITPLNVGGWIRAQFDPHVGILRREEMRPRNLTVEQYAHITTRMMDESKTVAQVVGLRAAGYQVELSGQGAEVQDILADAPAAGVLEVGDVITRVGDLPVRTNTELVATIGRMRPGSDAQLTVRRNDQDVPVTVRLGAMAEDRDRPRLGIVILSRAFTANLPVEVRIRTQDIGGSSGGLMFALAVYQGASKSDLTVGHKVAGTGALNISGSVEAIAGARYKVWAAEDAGAELFLVPVANADEARKAATRINVVPVETFDDALLAIRTLTGH